MELVRHLLSNGIALAFDGVDVHHHRAAQLPGPLQHMAQPVHIVAVHRPQVGEAHVLKKRTARPDRLFYRGLDAVVEAIQALSAPTVAQSIPVPLFEMVVTGPGPQMGQMARHGPHIGVDRHAVIVEQNDQRLTGGSGIVQALIGKAAGERTIADQRQHLIISIL